MIFVESLTSVGSTWWFFPRGCGVFYTGSLGGGLYDMESTEIKQIKVFIPLVQNNQ